jgi:hypothetical protein
MMNVAMDQMAQGLAPVDDGPIVRQSHEQFDIGGEKYRFVSFQDQTREFAHRCADDLDPHFLGSMKDSQVRPPARMGEPVPPADGNFLLIRLRQDLDGFASAVQEKRTQDDAMGSAAQDRLGLGGENERAVIDQDVEIAMAQNGFSETRGAIIGTGIIMAGLPVDPGEEAGRHQTAMIGV